MAFEHLQIDVHATAHGILPQKPSFLRLRQRFLQILAFFVVLVIHIDKRRLGLHCIGPDEAAFDELVRR